MKHLKKQHGITLISLVITIIILLILAGVTINLATNGGLIDSAQIAKNKWHEAQVEEQTELGKYLEEFEKHGSSSISMLDGDGQTYFTLAPTALSFRSSANIEDFQEVQVNGETIDQSNYTIAEGSTIINLSIDYLKTLTENDYSISIVSKTGSPSARFSVVEPDINSDGFYYNQPYTAYLDAFGSDMTFIIREDGTVDATAFSSDTGSTPSVESCSYSVSGNTITITSSMGSFTGTVSPDGMEINFEALSANAVLNNNIVAADEHYVYTYKDDGTYWAAPIDAESLTYAVPTLTNVNDIPVALATYAFNSYYDGNAILEDATVVCNIGYGSFWKCNNLKSVTIGKDVTSIGSIAFEGCTSLNSITIPSSVTQIGSKAFLNCTSLTDITFKGTVEQWNNINFGEYWNEGVPATNVACSDGTVNLN